MRLSPSLTMSGNDIVQCSPAALSSFSTALGLGWNPLQSPAYAFTALSNTKFLLLFLVAVSFRFSSLYPLNKNKTFFSFSSLLLLDLFRFSFLHSSRLRNSPYPGICPDPLGLRCLSYCEAIPVSDGHSQCIYCLGVGNISQKCTHCLKLKAWSHKDWELTKTFTDGELLAASL